MSSGLETAGPTEAASETVEQWCRAGETGDIDLAMSAIAADVVLRSPLTDRLRFEGRDHVRHVLHTAYENIDAMEFHTTVGGADTWGLFYTGRIGGTTIEEAQLVRLNEDNKIVEVTLMIRPLAGLVAVMAAFGPRMARRLGRPAIVAVAVSLMIKPLVMLARAADIIGARLVRSSPAAPGTGSSASSRRAGRRRC